MGRRPFSILMLLVITLLILSPSQTTSADYLGPARQRNVCTRELDCCNYSYRNTNPVCSAYGYSGSPCTCTINCVNCITGADTCLSSVPVLQVQAHCGGSGWTQTNNWKSYKETCHTETLPEATISTEFMCETPGNDGWCVNGAVLQLNAIEPVAQKVITYFETNDNQMLCDPEDGKTVSCTHTLQDGEGTITAWAHSSYGDTTRQITTQYKVDTVLPEHNIALPQPDGEKGWYQHPVIIEPNFATDLTSGLAFQEIQLNIDAHSRAPIWVAEDGVHNIHFFSEDNAGNSRVSSCEIRIDQTPPQITTNLPAIDGNEGWYKNPLRIEFGSEDETSGIERSWLLLDEQEFEGSTLQIEHEGIHLLQYFALDNAGNEVSSEAMSLHIDFTPPELIVDAQTIDEPFLHGIANFAGMALDEGSGLAALYWAVDNGIEHRVDLDQEGNWQIQWNTEEVTGGEHHLTIYVEDRAGNRQSWNETFQISNKAPTVFLTDRWQIGETGTLIVNQGDLPMASVRVLISSDELGDQELFYSTQNNNIEIEILWNRLINGVYAPSGEYKVTVLAIDIAGQESAGEGVILIPDDVNSQSPLTPTETSPTITPSLPTYKPSPTAFNPINGIELINTPEQQFEYEDTQLTLTATVSPEAVEIVVEHTEDTHEDESPLFWLICLIGLFLLFGISGCIDPRPRALHRMRDDINNFEERGKNE